MENNNQRQVERISTSQPISIFHHHSEETGKMIDLSIAGSGLITKEPIKEGESICIKFHLPQSSTQSDIEIMGKVVHSAQIRHEYLIGLTFTEVQPSYQHAIQEFINHHHALSS